MAENVLNNNLLEQYKEDMQRYGVYVTRKRSTPSIIDGLKPIHRRILYSAYEFSHATSSSSKRKSSTIKGNVMQIHPHGDAAIYGAFPGLINDFEIKVPLMTGYSSFGTIHGDGAAADRYTEASLSKFTMDCILDDMIKNNKTIDWDMAYSNIKEPEYLPVKVPLLLINGSFAIGFGSRVDISSHNLGDVIDQTIALIQNPTHKVFLVPDHCMPCYIENTNWQEISELGYGSYKVRGIIDIEEYRGTTALVLKSLPNLTFLNTIHDKLEDLIDTNKIIHIDKTYDESSLKGMRYVIVLKKGADPNYVREMIYKNTEMEQNVRVNFEVLDGITPRRISYNEYIQYFIEFRRNTKFRLYCNKLQSIQTSRHEIEAYLALLESGEILKVLNMLHNRKTVEDDNALMEFLIKKLNITDVQATYILESKTKKIHKGNIPRYKERIKQYIEEEKFCMSMITNDKNIDNEIINDLLGIKAKYGSPRTTKLVKKFTTENVPEGEFKIILTINNYIKKIGINDNLTISRNDKIKQVITAENTSNILLFDEVGKVYKLPVNKISFADKNSSGLDLRLLIKGLTSTINSIVSENIIENYSKSKIPYYLVVLSNAGYIKRMDLRDFNSINTSGMVYSKLDDGDTVKNIMVIPEGSDIIVYSNKKVIRLNTSMIPYLKRNTRGTKCMNVDTIDGMSMYSEGNEILVITGLGKFNRIMDTIPYARTKAGTNIIKLSTTDKIIGVYNINNKDTLNIQMKNGNISLPVKDIPYGSTVSKGEQLINIHGNPIINFTLIKG